MKKDTFNLGGQNGFPVSTDDTKSASLEGSSLRHDNDTNATGRAEATIQSASRPRSTPQEYNRVMFLARIILAFTVLASLTLGIIAVATGRNYISIVVGVALLVAAVIHYVWIRHVLRREMRLSHPKKPALKENPTSRGTRR